jgi:hypothetical protein
MKARNEVKSNPFISDQSKIVITIRSSRRKNFKKEFPVELKLDQSVEVIKYMISIVY